MNWYLSIISKFTDVFVDKEKKYILSKKKKYQKIQIALQKQFVHSLPEDRFLYKS